MYYTSFYRHEQKDHVTLSIIEGVRFQIHMKTLCQDPVLHEIQCCILGTMMTTSLVIWHHAGVSTDLTNITELYKQHSIIDGDGRETELWTYHKHSYLIVAHSDCKKICTYILPSTWSDNATNTRDIQFVLDCHH